jgi:hypothetical protein
MAGLSVGLFIYMQRVNFEMAAFVAFNSVPKASPVLECVRDQAG